jgi:hypothetical protein
MTLTGCLIGESLRTGASLDRLLTISKIARSESGEVDAGQPVLWTFIEFEAPAEEADVLAHELSQVLEPSLGWYCDFRTDDETFVVFANRVFRYPRGDATARAEAESYARSVGVPESQLDWPV